MSCLQNTISLLTRVFGGPTLVFGRLPHLTSPSLRDTIFEGTMAEHTWNLPVLSFHAFKSCTDSSSPLSYTWLRHVLIVLVCSFRRLV